MEGLSHAVSQPNILHIKQPSPHLKHKRPTGKAACVRPEFATVLCVIILPISIILQSNLPFIISYMVIKFEGPQYRTSLEFSYTMDPQTSNGLMFRQLET
jgi:hypothetical protein